MFLPKGDQGQRIALPITHISSEKITMTEKGEIMEILNISIICTKTVALLSVAQEQI